MGATELQALRARISETPVDSQGHRRFSAPLRNDVVRYARARVGEGLSQKAVARELGLSSDTLHGWMAVATKAQPARRIRPVIITARRPNGGAQDSGGAPVVVLPGGVRIEGVRLEDVPRLVKELA